MKRITFTITADEIMEVAELNSSPTLSRKEVREVLLAVECDEILWGDIRESITSGINDVIDEQVSSK